MKQQGRRVLGSLASGQAKVICARCFVVRGQGPKLTRRCSKVSWLFCPKARWCWSIGKYRYLYMLTLLSDVETWIPMYLCIGCKSNKWYRYMC